MNPETRAAAEEALNYTFQNEALLEQALTHASVSDGRLESNERLEFLGDAVLGLISCELIYRKFPEQLEGDMTKIKSVVVSRRTCARIARDLGLEPLLSLGKGMRHHTQLPSSLAACVFEAVIAAVYMDGGYERTREVLKPMLEPHIDRADRSGHQQNFKSVLQQHAQQNMDATPTYRVLDEQGPDHAKCFKVAVDLGSRRFPESWGQSKKQAEQQAALNALRELGIVEQDEDGEIRVVVTEESA